MSQERPKVDVLVVDDRPEQLLAIQAILEPLGENVVAVRSGREALRQILWRSSTGGIFIQEPGQTREAFALILLDINMPGLDGFETAELIRSHRSSRETPIIFLTAAGDDLHVDRSYALGAVDYIMTPVVPDVLRSKVRVFADLYRKTMEIERQRQRLELEATRLHRLTEASIAINSVLTIDGILQAITEAARRVTRAEEAVTMLELNAGASHESASFSDTHAAFRGRPPVLCASALFTLACPSGTAVRLTQREVEARPELHRACAALFGPQRSGLLATPLTEGDGQLIGLIQLSDKQEGEFTEGDQDGLIQLAQLGSIAIQNCLHAEAREANRLKDEFLATLSHELRTPLNAILGWTRLLRNGPSDPARIARGLEVIERNVGVQTALIEDLLDVSRIAAGKLRLEKRPLDVGPIVEAALDAVRPTAEAKGVVLHASLDPNVGRTLGDGERLQQVAFNLVGNAVKFTSSGGRVDIRVQRWRDEVELVVADTGVGISPEFLPFVFERFRQADSSATRAKTGLGLGLALVRDLVELHGGSVRAESPGQGLGATFTVRLKAVPTGARVPAVINEGPAPVSRVECEGAPVSGVQALAGLRVLVVDDDDDARELLREVLSQHRADVWTASSAREALAAMEAAKPHVLVSDIAMKGEDGYELIRRVRVRPPHEGGGVPALALTAFARSEDRLRALEAGFQMHAAKPIEPTELIAAVASLAGNALASGVLAR